MRMPTIKRDNQATCVEFGFVTVWFSYETPIAFQFEGQPRVVSENVWSATTGRHLSAIDGGDKKSRVDHAQFGKIWDLEMAAASLKMSLAHIKGEVA
jgi:hypothetical protein